MIKKQMTSRVWINGIGAVGYTLLVTAWALFVTVVFALVVDLSSAGAPLEVDKLARRFALPINQQW